MIEEYTPDGDVINAYTYGWDLISQDDGTDRVYYQVDGLGSTRNITDINGDVVVEYTFDAYGNLINQVGDSDNNYLFTGEQFDNEIGLNYNRARYYDPNTGRFISRDPFEGFNDMPVTLHDYLYAGNNPINFVDPSGELLEYAARLGVLSAKILAARAAANGIAAIETLIFSAICSPSSLDDIKSAQLNFFIINFSFFLPLAVLGSAVVPQLKLYWQVSTGFVFLGRCLAP